MLLCVVVVGLLFEAGSRPVAQAGLQFKILLYAAPHWDYRCVLCNAQAFVSAVVWRQRSPVPDPTISASCFPRQNEGEGWPSHTVMTNSCWGHKGRLVGRREAPVWELVFYQPLLPVPPSTVVSCRFSCDEVEGFLTAKSLSDHW